MNFVSQKPAPGGPTQPSSSQPSPPPAPRWARWITPLLLVAITPWWAYGVRLGPAATVSYTELYTLLSQGKVASVTLAALQVSGKLKQEETVGTRKVTTF